MRGPVAKAFKVHKSLTSTPQDRPYVLRLRWIILSRHDDFTVFKRFCQLTSCHGVLIFTDKPLGDVGYFVGCNPPSSRLWSRLRLWVRCRLTAFCDRSAEPLIGRQRPIDLG